MTSHRPEPPWIGRLIVRLWPLGHRRQEIEDDLRELFEKRVRSRTRRYAALRYGLDALSLWRWRMAASASIDVPGSTVGRHGGGWNGLGRDVTFAVRMFARQPGIVLMTVAGLSLAIGISTVILTIVNAVTLRGTGIRDIDALYGVEVSDLTRGRLVGGYSPYRGNWAYIDFIRLGVGVPSMDLAADSPFTIPVEVRVSADRSRAESVHMMPVSGNYFGVLGARTRLGRAIGSDDDTPGAHRVAVLSHALWKIRFDSSPGVVGRLVWLDDVPFTVIGVTEPGFVGAHGSKIQVMPAVWIPFASQAAVWTEHQNAAKERTANEVARLASQPAIDALSRLRLEALRASLESAPDRWNVPVDVVGRLKPGASSVRAETELTLMARAFAAEGRGGDRPASVHLGPSDRGRVEPALVAIVLAVVSILVTLGCANVTNLLLANAAGRRREIGTRLALGASRSRLVRQLITESVLLATCAGLAGLVISSWLAPFAARVLGLPPLTDFAPDLGVYTVTALVALTSGVVAGLAPARYGWRGHVVSALQSDREGSSGATGSTRVRSVLIGGQAAACIVLLVLAALLTRSAIQVAGYDTGVSIDRLVNVSPNLGSSYDATRRKMFVVAALDRLERLPGVDRAALATVPPFHSFHAAEQVTGSMVNPGPTRVQRNEVSVNYFETVGVRVLQGRTFSEEEIRNQLPVAVISASLAWQFWGEASPIGSTMERVWGTPDRNEQAPGNLMRKPAGTKVIGVVTDSMTQVDDHGLPTIYLPIALDEMVAHIVVATHVDPRVVAGTARRELLALDPDQTPFVALPSDRLRNAMSASRSFAVATGAIGASALALAVIGLFGVTAFVVGQRRREISIRMALGASGREVVRMLVRDSLRPVAIGLCCGLVLAFVAGQLISKVNVLFGVSGHDPIALISATTVLLGTAAAAAFMPARRASRIDPAAMLKVD